MKSILITYILMSISTYAYDIITPIPIQSIYDNDKALLGKKLFYDVQLSGDANISCSSCHRLDQGGASHRRYPLSGDGHVGVLNSPTVLNTIYSFTHMRDGSAHSLQEQVLLSIQSPAQMGADIESVVTRLRLDDDYQREFAKSYPDAITSDNIVDAIVEFEKALTTPNSRFDKYLRGEKSAISKYEIEGYRLFIANGCTSCHNGVNIGSNLYQRVGIAKQYTHSEIDSKHELGRFNITKNIDDKYMVKVPTLRNIELTAPYLHNGSLSNLRITVNFMLEYQVGILTNPDDILKIVAFLRTLTGENPKIMQGNDEK